MAKPSEAFVSIVAAQASDDDLVARARNDPCAFADLYDRYLPRVYRYLFSKVSSQADAEDLTSQVFIAALEAFPRYRHKGHFNAWLFSIARRKAADHYRRHISQAPIEQARVEEISLHNFLTEVVKQDELRRLADLITKLNEQEQELLRLRFAARLGFAEIARLLKRTEGAVKMSLYRLLEQLESQLEANDE
jgi:RNA polymerase sigma-70 factor (ECF subfamily)